MYVPKQCIYRTIKVNLNLHGAILLPVSFHLQANLNTRLQTSYTGPLKECNTCTPPLPPHTHKHPHSHSRHLGPQVSRGKKAGQRVPDEHQLVRRHDETLAPGHEDARRLVALHAAEEHVDGVRQAGEVSEALRRVKGQQLRVLQREGHRQGGGRGHL